VTKTKVRCPECDAVVTSKDGFEPGQTVMCPKCEAYFTPGGPEKPARKRRPVREPEPDDSEEFDDRPRKKKFPVGTAVAAVLLVLLIGGGVFSFVWYRNEEAKKRERDEAELGLERARQNGPVEPGTGGGGPGPKKGGGRPIPKPNMTETKGGGGGGGGLPISLDALTGGSGQSAAEVNQTKAALRPQLVGTWRTKPGAAPARTIEYRTDGTFRDEVTGGRVVEGKWEVADVLGKKGLKLKRAGGGPAVVRVTFEDGELIHDADDPGTTSVLVKE
jgi:hypothetical protein